MRSVKRFSVASWSTLSFLLLMMAWSGGSVMAAQDALICPADRLNSNGNICTAADVQLAAAALSVSQTGLTCTPGETIDVAMAGNVNLRKGDRFDIGVWVSTDGKPMDLRGGTNGAPDEGGAQTCEVLPLPYQPISEDSSPGVFIIDSFDDGVGIPPARQDCYDTSAANNGDISSAFLLTSERDSIINGLVDSNNDGAINTGPNGPDTTTVLKVFGVHVIAGALDMNDDGIIDATDTGTWNGYPVGGTGGVVDADGDGTFGGAGDNSAQAYNDLVTMLCVAGPTGKLALETLVSWHVPSDAALVCDPTVPDSYTVNNSAKCSVSSSEVEVDIVGKLTVIKLATPADGSDFEFTYTNDSPPLADQDPNDAIPDISPASPFTLKNGGLDDIYAEIGTGPATIVITETNLPTGWDLADLQCFGDDLTPVVIDIANKTATVTLEYNDVNPLASQSHVTCTFNNKTLPSLKIVKNTAGGNGAFDFVGDNGIGPFTLDTTAPTPATDSVTFTNLQPADNYSIVESIPFASGWNLSSASCSNGSGDLTITDDVNGDPEFGQLTNITLALGENVTCTFNNALGAIATITKSTVGGDDTFGFTTDLPGALSFTLTTSGGSSPLESVSNLPADTYFIEEDVKAGWELTGIECLVDGTPSGTVSDRRITLTVAVGQSVACTFSNEKHATLQVNKQTDPNGDPATFEFAGTVNGTVTDNNNLEFTGPAGVFTTNESAMAGWDLTSINCGGAINSTFLIGGTADFVDGDTEVVATMAPGETLVCVYGNTKRGSLTIVKSITAVGPASQDFTFTSDIPGNATFPLSPVDAATDAQHEMLDLKPGLYTVTEDDPTAAGWALISDTCGDGSPTGGILLDPGEDLICTFENAPLGSATIVKTTVGGDGGPFEFTWGNLTNNSIPEGEPSIFTLTTPGPTATMDFSNTLLINNPYDLAETDVPVGVGPYSQTWNLTDTSCVDATGDSTFNPGLNGADATIVAAAAETVACTFTNTLDGTLVIRKQTLPDGDVTDFTFTGSHAGLTGNLQDFDNAAAELSETGAPGIYTADESVPVGWVLTDISCTGAINSNVSIGGTPTFDPVAGDTDISVDLAAGETVICTYTNTKDGSLTIIKDAVGDDGSFSFNHNVPNITSPFVIDTLIDDTKIISVALQPGSYRVSEVIPTNWDLTNIDCTGWTDSTITYGLAGDFAPGDDAVTVGLKSGEDIICTFTNTRRTALVTLQKNWIGGVINDTSILDMLAPAGNATNTSTALGGDQLDTINTTVVTELTGNSLIFNETLGGVGFYTTSFACTGNTNLPVYADGTTSATLVLNEADTAVTCTFTNTINTAQLTLQKEWVGGVVDDTAALDATGTLGTQTATATATGGDETSANTAVITALVGETVTLSEVLGGVGDYTAGFSCTSVNAPTYTAGDLSATLLIDAQDQAITCTYTNTKVEPIINLAKVVNGPANHEADGTFTVVYTITASNTGGFGTYNLVDAFSPGAGITLTAGAPPVAVYQAGTESTQTGTLAAYPNFVTDEGLVGGLNERWIVTANFTVDPALTDPATSACATDGSAINTGFYNLVTGSVTDPDLTDNDACTDLPQPGINLAKTVNGPAVRQPGGTYMVVYTITATNTGEGSGVYDLIDAFTPGVGITLDTADAVYLAGTEDSQTGTLGAYPNFVTGEALAAGMDESWTVTAIFSIDMALVTAEGNDCDRTNAGGDNTGFTNGVTGSDTDTDLTDNTACTEFIPPVISLVKTSDVPSYDAVGDVIHYSYLITNLGPDILDPGLSSVADDKETVTCPAAAPLPVGGTVTCTASHVITQTDLDAGSLTNVATAKVGDVTSNEDIVTVIAEVAPPVTTEVIAVPVNDKLALLLLTLMLLATGWYFRPAVTRKL